MAMDMTPAHTSMHQIANRTATQICGGQYLGCTPSVLFAGVPVEALMCVSNHAASTPYGFPVPGPAAIVSGAAFAPQGDAQILLGGYAYSGNTAFVETAPSCLSAQA